MAAYFSNLLTVDADGIALDTGLSPREAAQSKLTQYLKESGYIARKDSDGMWSFIPWTWDDTKTAIPQGRKNEAVFVTGPAWNGVPLYTLLEDAMADGAAAETLQKATNAVNILNQVTEAAAADSRVQLPLSGPAAILSGTGENEGTLLFLPVELFIRALQSRGDNERSRYEGLWVNPVLSGLDAWRFTVASCAYALLYGKPAYTSLNTDQRKEDCLDRNHVPLADSVTGQKAELLKAIDHNLNQQGPVSKKARRAKNQPSDAIIQRETYSTSHSVEMPAIEPFSARSVKSPEQLPQWQQFQKRLKRIRFVRKYQTAIKIAAASLIVILIFAFTIIRDSKDRPTTAGLTRDQVIEMYYKGIDTLDTELFDAARYKKAGKGWSNYISTMFVTSKMRENYESIHTWTPGQWLWLKNPEKVNVFGVSNLQYEIIREYDDGSADYRTDFYIIQLTLGGELTVTRYTGTISAGKIKNSFRITADDVADSEIPVDLQQFLADLAQAAEGAEAPAIGTAIRAAYPWMPSDTDIMRGKEELESGEY